MEHRNHERHLNDEEVLDDEDMQQEQEDQYDEDVFSLEEDLIRERRKQWIQYILVATLAALVVAAALYGSIVWTNSRLEREKNSIQPVTPIDNAIGGTAAPDAIPSASAIPKPVNAWPSDAFPGIPVLESEAYETRSGSGYADVIVPSSTAKAFDAYIAKLAEAGAAIFVRTPRLSVVNLDGVEIHLVTSNQENRVSLYDEPRYDWADPTYSAFVLPQTGKLVSVEDGVGAGSRILTYRDATTVDALEYVNALESAGWTLSGAFEPSNNIVSAVYKKNNVQITVDYFSTGDNYKVKLDYLG
ncbi:MAG: hypothetical protein RR452_06770 [Clostridia bacterium]